MRTLSKTETRVGLLLSAGKSHKEAACILRRSVRTIDRHCSNIMEKTRSRNLADLTRWFYTRYSGQREDVILRVMRDTTWLVACVLFLVMVANAADDGLLEVTIKNTANQIRDFFNQ